VHALVEVFPKFETPDYVANGKLVDFTNQIPTRLKQLDLRLSTSRLKECMRANIYKELSDLSGGISTPN